jgi:hypothetical protein
MRLVTVALVSIVVVLCAPTYAQEAAPRNPLVGNWRYIDSAGCGDFYYFRADGSFSSASGLESREGRYSLEPPSELTNGRFKVTRTTTFDNRLVDCGGSTLDDTGKTDVRYVYFSRNNNELMVCPTAVSNTCFGPLARVNAK